MNTGDNIKLQFLFKRHKINTKLRLKPEIEPVQKKYFTHTVYMNLPKNYLQKAAQWEVNKKKTGNNTGNNESSSERKRGKF